MVRYALIATLCAALLAPSAYAETITIAADEWCPYNCAPGSDQPGFMIEIAREVLGKHGISVNYVNVSWSRAISDTRKKKYDAIVGATTGDAPDFVFPAVAQGFSAMGFYTAPDSTWEYHNLDSLAGVSLGAIMDYSYSDEVDDYIKKNKNDRKLVQLVSGDKALLQNVKKLRSHRVDAIIDDINVLSNFLANTDQERSVRQAGTLSYKRGYAEQLIYVAFGPKQPKAKEYARLMSKGTRELRASGELQKILDRYSVKDWKDIAE
ncbi:MAG: transporter substrate-binding domain-containing protein [Rickettsiales bacterium]